MSSNWMWLLVLVAAVAHAPRWVAPDAALRQVKLPGAFTILYVVYAVVLARAGLAGMLVAFLIGEALLQIFRRRRPAPAGRGGGGAASPRR